MRKFPAPIHNAIAALSRLPGVGPKTALRYVFALLRMNKQDREIFARAVINLENITECSVCFTHSEDPVCAICKDSQRSNSVLCVVSESRDISTIEATNTYHGKYFVFGGTLNPIEGATPETLNMRELVERLKSRPEIKEVILAFSPDVHGETTIMFLSRKIKQLGRKTTKLARGLPIGADIEYADEVTLGDALLGRRET
ncbi:recombination protein RecR [Candidatus Uhrbacteria bacterium CG_4_9_14_0_2_um_filter_41_50]|uniref:Recombination protein RecR n=1 Tax=Candidatus Uhrbacteria bacterium CG_4_9_14_0_2_um_filter_41_50 TaxID=1975031 RepID=A0A2M8EMZ1_9BACT|nr:MAG: recombination protein RecR [Candidatus Uhrbacteria bacterium CG_4_10_14_3_um_filter_41_21]PIZ54700.1 MAG: recombination protein RecR [Candidatus Uhrbacteria bacterium CG_4_10_14_0_2_um_filter_41_21]PJB84721.1 MAG: recombination protein RecR [Candidatus Uhrbacteria bacterium CG_4_9_14_0_8_um_filter_41_16]PJC24099.1 MAG: recombination protein RecR [Candidatus Uhrbacteria bacterium CG_4_9_14_0_2_um_filter_41_50]PJE74791.1 MAG: recombination protein RecR [Candidatus Uhrbacteria bacterium CG